MTAYTYSDRDLLTEEVSPVAGTTVSSYNEHGELVNRVDGAGTSLTRTVDALDRVTQENYPGTLLDVSFTYGMNPSQFNVGRLIRISSSSKVLSFNYDRFGRLLRDGDLLYVVDKNGNRTQITYPQGVRANYTYDFADRPATLTVRVTGMPAQPVVSAASYKPFGPLSELALSSGLTESRSFDGRYVPAGITLGNGTSLLDWGYTTDGVGNVRRSPTTWIRSPTASTATRTSTTS